MTEIGDRVGAILEADRKSIKFFGYGTYVGEEVPEEAVGHLANQLRLRKEPNPKIELDNGGVVYGCECWWDAEEEVRKRLEGYKPEQIIKEDINNVRTSRR